MGRARSGTRRRRPSGPPSRTVDADALPPIFRVTHESDAFEAPLNAAARRLDLPEGVRRTVRRLGEGAIASSRWHSDCVASGGTTWLAIVAPCDGAAQVVLLPVSVDADPGRLDDLAPGLTPREREVLTLSLRGGSPREISAQLGISWHTVRTHLKHAYRALGVSGRAEAVSVVLESARPRVHLRMIADDVEPSSSRHPRPPSSRHTAPSAASSGRSRPPSRSHAKPPSTRPHPRPPTRPPSRSHPKPASTRPPSRPR